MSDFKFLFLAFLALLFPALSAHSASTTSDPVSLFESVYAAEEQRMLEQHKDFINIESYEASAYRLVRINKAAFSEETKSITIELFDSEKVIVIKNAHKSDDPPHVWRGTIQPWGENKPSSELAEAVKKHVEQYPDIWAVNLVIIHWDEYPNNALQPHWERENAIGTSPTLKEEQGIRYNAYLSVSGGFYVPSQNMNYELKPLPGQTDVHLFYSKDHNLSSDLGVTNGDDTITPQTPQQKERWRKYWEFMKSKGLYKTEKESAEAVRDFYIAEGINSVAEGTPAYENFLKHGIDPKNLNGATKPSQGKE